MDFSSNGSLLSILLILKGLESGLFSKGFHDSLLDLLFLSGIFSSSSFGFLLSSKSDNLLLSLFSGSLSLGKLSNFSGLDISSNLSSLDLGLLSSLKSGISSSLSFESSLRLLSNHFLGLSISLLLGKLEFKIHLIKSRCLRSFFSESSISCFSLSNSLSSS